MTEPHPDRPRFFGGQLLTEGDLDDLVSWTRSCVRRLGRAHGAQILEGLGVSALDGETPAVRISAGSALDGAGQLVVQSQDEDLTIPAEALTSARQAGPLRREPPFVRIGEARQLRFPVLLSLRLSEEPTAPRSRLGHHAGSADGIENSRVREQAEFHFDPEDGGHPTRHGAQPWRQAFDDCSAIVKQFHGQFIEGGASLEGLDGEAVRTWLRDQLTSADAHAFAFLPGLLDSLSTEELRAGATLARLLFLAVMDRRLAHLHAAPADRTAATGGEEAGDGTSHDGHSLILARLWIGEGEEPGSDRRLLAVDQTPRAALREPGLPAPEGRLNLADVLWSTPAEGEVLVARRGLRFASEEPLLWDQDMASLEDLDRSLDLEPFVAPWDEIVLRTIDLGDMGRRVVGFRALGEGRERHVRVQIQAHPHHVVPGQEISLVIQLHNTGPVPLLAELILDGSPLGGARPLPPRLDIEEQLRWRVPAGLKPGARTVDGQLRIRARGDEGPVESPVSFDLEVLDPTASQFSHELDVKPHALTGRLACSATIRNTGSTPLTLSLTWSLGSVSCRPIPLEVPVGASVAQVHPALGQVGRRVPLTLEITGVGGDGRTIGVTGKQSLPSGLGLAPWMLVLVLCGLSWIGGTWSGAEEPSTLTLSMASVGALYLGWRFLSSRTVWIHDKSQAAEDHGEPQA